MSVFDHQEADGICLWDHEVWPCMVAKARAEMIALLEAYTVGNTGDPAYDQGRESGLGLAVSILEDGPKGYNAD